MDSTLISRADAVLLNTYRRQPVVFVRGEGSCLFDDAGRRYLDFVAGVAVNALGVNHPAWVRAISAQAAELHHTSNLYYTTPMVELAERLVTLSGMDRVFFCNSGAEANEAALKIARKWGKVMKGPRCTRIISLSRGFHGRTLGALSATANPHYCEPFTPLVPDIEQISFHDLATLDRRMDEECCALIMEPIQGEGGVYPTDPRCLQGIRSLCDERRVLWIADEVQTGVGRTGRWFDVHHAGVLPDLMPLAKGLGGGFPIGACLARGEAATVLQPGDHGSTFAGNLLAARAALTVLEIIERDHLLEQVSRVGELIRSRLQQEPLLTNVRGRGLMIGTDCARGDARNVVTRAREQGLLVNATSDQTIRLVPPLILTEAEALEGIEILRGALAGPAS